MFYLKIENLHQKALTINHQSNASYRNLFECNGSISIQQRHFQFLLTETYNSTVTTNPKFM